MCNYNSAYEAANDLVDKFCTEYNSSPMVLLGVDPPWATKIQYPIQQDPLHQFADFILQELNAGTKIFTFYSENLDEYASWLFKSDIDQFRVLIDIPHIKGLRNWPDHATDLLLTRIFLHELGHIVQHRDHMFRNGLGKADNCLAEHEEYAWNFAASVVGLALGDYAKKCKESNQPDKAWLFA